MLKKNNINLYLLVITIVLVLFILLIVFFYVHEKNVMVQDYYRKYKIN